MEINIISKSKYKTTAPERKFNEPKASGNEVGLAMPLQFSLRVVMADFPRDDDEVKHAHSHDEGATGILAASDGPALSNLFLFL